MVEFMGYVLDDANALWADTFQRAAQYTPTVLVLFEGGTQSGCGAASSQTGPFYCPLDQKVYIDLDFFKELATGSGRRATSPRRTCSPTRSRTTSSSRPASRTRSAAGSSRTRRSQNELSVRLELQADCLAGVWAQSVYQQGDLERGDLEEGLNGRVRGRRRPDPGECRDGREPGDLDPRVRGAAVPVVQHGLRLGRSGGLRHLRPLRVTRGSTNCAILPRSPAGR